jgi:hypothetical protein
MKLEDELEWQQCKDLQVSNRGLSYCAVLSNSLEELGESHEEANAGHMRSDLLNISLCISSTFLQTDFLPSELTLHQDYICDYDPTHVPSADNNGHAV